MDVRYGREITVGTIVLLAVAGFIAGTMWLSGKNFGTGGVVVAFNEVGALKRGSPVRVSGVPVGKVEEIELVAVGDVRVTLGLDRELPLKADASAQVVSVGLAGDAAVALDPGRAAEPLAAGAAIPGRAQAELSGLAGGLAARGESLMVNLQRLTDTAAQRRFDRLLDELTATLAVSRRAMETFASREAGPTAELERTLAEYRALAATLDSTLHAPALVRARDRSDTLVRNLSAMTAQFRATGERLDSLLAGVARGEGTLGKLARDSAFHDRTVHLLGSIDSLVTELRRHPGRIGVTVKMF